MISLFDHYCIFIHFLIGRLFGYCDFAVECGNMVIVAVQLDIFGCADCHFYVVLFWCCKILVEIVVELVLDCGPIFNTIDFSESVLAAVYCLLIISIGRYNKEIHIRLVYLRLHFCLSLTDKWQFLHYC